MKLESKRSKIEISLFDLDHTLIKGNCSYYFGSHLYKKGQLPLGLLWDALLHYAFHRIHLLSMQSLHTRLFTTLFKKKSAVEMKKLAAEMAISHISQIFYQPALQRLKEAQAEGQRVIILSSSPDFIVTFIAQYLKVTEWAATPYLVDQEHCFSALGTVLTGEQKKNYVQQLKLNRDVTAGYSDSHLDLPFLEAVGYPVAVCPNRKLRTISQRRCWEIL